MLIPSICISALLLCQATGGLADQLHDPDTIVRLKAAKLLGDLGANGKDSLNALKKAAQDDPDSDVRLIAKQAIKKIESALSSKNNTDIIDPLISGLRSGNNTSKAKALEKLKDLGPKAIGASESIINCLGSPSNLIRGSALAALESVNPELSGPVVTILVDDDSRMRTKAVHQIQAMAEKGKPAASLLVYILTKGEQKTNQQFRGYVAGVDIINCLETIAPDMPDYCASLLLFAQQRVDGSGGVRIDIYAVKKRVIQLIPKKVQAGLLDPKKATLSLIECMNDRQTVVDAIHSAGILGSDAKAAITSLTQLKTNPSQAVREAASEALERIQGHP
jgi:HEAT repeat protein